MLVAGLFLISLELIILTVLKFLEKGKSIFVDNTTTSSKSVVWSWETDRLLNNNIKRAKTFFI